MPAIRMNRIVPQIINVRGEEVEVNCRHIRFFPYEEDGELKFGLLKYAPWQVCIQRATWGDAIVKVRYIDTTGKFSIIFNEQMDPVDPTDRRWEPGKVRKIVNRIDGLNTDQVEAELARMCKMVDSSLPPDQQPVDHEFIDEVLGELIVSAESARKAA